MACIITYENKQYTQKEFEQYFKEHFTEFVGDFLSNKKDIEGFEEFVNTSQQFNLREQLALELAAKRAVAVIKANSPINVENLSPEERLRYYRILNIKKSNGGEITLEDINENSTLYQLPQNREIEEFVASEKTIRDLAARMSDRIGIPFKFESDRTKEYKGKIENSVAYINLAYATLDTPIHEILAHPIIRAIKNGNKFQIEENLTEKDADKIIEKNQVIEKNGIRYLAAYDAPDGTIIYRYDKTIQTNPKTELYQNLLKELETGRGKEVLDRIKRDYKYKVTAELITNRFGDYGIKQGNTESFVYDNKEQAEEDLKIINSKEYTLEEQQEEAIVELLGLMTAEKLDNVKDGKLISLLKRLLKEMKQFIRSLINQKEIEIDNLPDNLTINDLANILAYSSSKLILPGYEVEYTTPDNMKFKTYQEASNHISDLAKNVKDIDLDNVKLNPNLEKEIQEKRSLLEEQLKQVEDKIREANNELDKLVFIGEKMKSKFEFTNEYKEYLNQYKEFTDNNLTPLRKQEKEIFEKINEIRLEKGMYASSGNTILNFIQKNKEYEQSKEIIEEWKKVNNIKYNPEEVYSRGQEFVSVVGAYSNFDVNLMMQNLLTHIEDNEKANNHNKITSKDKIVFGHPGIGKTYLRESGRTDVIDFDSDYKSKINKKFNLPEGFKARNDFQKNNKEEYQKAVRELWKEAKKESKETGKQLFASDMILLREFAKDFDKVITMSKETFVNRAKQRNDYTQGETESWKNSLDNEINKINKSKVINTTDYLSDLFSKGSGFAISAYTKPVDKQIGHLEGGGGKIKFKIYPKSEDILWAANTDVYSGSVWDASEKVNKDKKSELLGVSYTKYPSLQNVDAVQPNLAAIIDNLSHHHNELAILLNFSNFEIEVDEDVPYQTKKIIENVNKILQQKRLEQINNFINKLEKEC